MAKKKKRRRTLRSLVAGRFARPRFGVLSIGRLSAKALTYFLIAQRKRREKRAEQQE